MLAIVCSSDATTTTKRQLGDAIYRWIVGWRLDGDSMNIVLALWEESWQDDMAHVQKLRSLEARGMNVARVRERAPRT